MTENAKKLYTMYKIFGVTKQQDAICRDCMHLIKREAGGRKVYKCKVYGDTASDATDWRIGWTACCMYNKSYSGTPIAELPARKKKAAAEEQIPGQMALELEK